MLREEAPLGSYLTLLSPVTHRAFQRNAATVVCNFLPHANVKG